MNIGVVVRRVVSTLLDVVLPEECVVCETPLVDGERYVCLHCRMQMPVLTATPVTDNAVHTTLATLRPVTKAAAWFRYRRGSPYTRIIHNAKYDGRPQLARWIGRQLATELDGSEFFTDIDALVPVPISRSKMLRRGYNQSERIARGVSDITGIRVANVMRARSHSSQTRRSASSRRRNIEGVYSVKPGVGLPGVSHVAIVDDVITTGSTLLACVDAFRKAYPGVDVSVLAGALTEI